MDFRYYNYILNSEEYYSLPKSSNSFAYKVVVPKGWKVIEGNHWTNVFCEREKLEKQGWKIHISCNIDQAQDVLTAIANFMYEINTSFKYVKNKIEWMNKNSKSAGREYSGKFITIYPRQDELLDVLTKLEKILSFSEKGPYILSDRRWKDTNIYYRYGGFVNITLEDGTPAIEDNEGKLVADKRQPFYNIPKWVNVPQFILDNEQEEVFETELDKYEIKSALHFSNSGGVYEAYYKKFGKVVIKEARPKAGLDGVLNDAVHRLKKEYETLSKISMLSCVTKAYEYFKAWEHEFLVLEYAEGDSLATWIAKNYPFAEDGNLKDYVNKLGKIADKCCEGLLDIHKLGITHGDIQPRNIIVNFDDDNVSIKFIDFETSGIVGEQGDKSLGTPGYFNNFEDYSDEKDWTGLLRIFKNALLAVTSLEMIVENCFDIQYKWIEKTFGKEATAILDKILACAKNEKYNLTTSKNKKYRLLEKLDNDLLRERAKESLAYRLDFNKVSLIHGDIKQFEYDFGDISVAYGAMGALLVLNRLNTKLELSEWYKKLEERLDFAKYPTKIENYGLYSGLSGVADTLTELENYNLAEKIYEHIITNIDNIVKTKNISLESGLSGIGLALLDYYIDNKNNRVLEAIQKINDRIEKIFLDNTEDIYTSNLAVSSDGLMYGWSGASMLLYGCYNVLEESRYLSRAKKYLLLEIDKFKNNDNMLLLKTKDHKLMPYFSVGSSGLAIPIILMQEYLEKETIDNFIKNIKGTLTAKPCVCAGFFEGYIGEKYIEKFISKYTGVENNIDFDCDLNQYVIEDKKGILNFPGNYSFRVSEDLATGLTGLLVYLAQDCVPEYLWLPIKNQRNILTISN